MRWSSGDYQIAPIAARSTAMGRWRLTPPWYGDAACGRDGGRGTPHPSRLRRATCLPAGRFAGLTRHRCVIQHREPSGGRLDAAAGRGTKDPSSVSFADTFPPGGRLWEVRHLATRTHQGEGLGNKKKRPGALLLALFIAFWWCRSGPSGTGATGRRRELRRGRRSWENPWHRRP